MRKTIHSQEFDDSFYFGRVRDFIWQNQQTLTPTDAAFMLMDFQHTHGWEAVLSMYGYLRYASTRKLYSGKVLETITHDLNSRFDKLCQPRCTAYIQFITI